MSTVSVGVNQLDVPHGLVSNEIELYSHCDDIWTASGLH